MMVLEILFMVGVMGIYAILGCLLLTAIFITLLLIDLLFGTKVGRRNLRNFFAFFRDDWEA